MRVAVTGGLGYIGCWLTADLATAGHDVYVFDSGIYPSGVAAYDDGWLGEVTWVERDIRRIRPLDLEGIDAVCHLAGLSNDPTADFDPELNKELNIIATKSIGEAALQAGIKKFTFASSASVYGFNKQGLLTEEDEVHPQSGYASSKFDAERVLLTMPDLNPVIFRQATVGGWSPRMRWDLVVNTMTLCALRDRTIKVYAGGEAYRPLVDVRDVATAHRLAIERGVEPGVYNLCHKREASQSGIEGYTVGCLALWIAHIVEESGYPSVNVKGDWSREEGRSYDISGKKLRDEFGWSPQYGVYQTVQNLLDVYSSNPEILPDSRNIDWMKCMAHAKHLQDVHGSVL